MNCHPEAVFREGSPAMLPLEMPPAWLFTEELNAWVEKPLKLHSYRKHRGRSFGQQQASG